MTSTTTLAPYASPDPAQRLLDVVGASMLLLASAPLLALCALAIRLDSPGPVLFRQARVGRGGRKFELLKLRTMVDGADPAPHERHVTRLLRTRLRAGPAGGQTGELPDGDRPGTSWSKLGSDPRVTRVGRLLRAMALDELPQLVNVLRGEMSLVGPRPALPYEVAHWREWHYARLAVRPGMTGLWQVEGWGKVDFDGMVRLDLAYIRSRSVWLDCRLLARTPWVLWRRRGDGLARRS